MNDDKYKLIDEILEYSNKLSTNEFIAIARICMKYDRRLDFKP